MNLNKVNDIARLATTGRCKGLVCGDVERVQHVPERAVRLGRKETKRSVMRPIQAGRLAGFAHNDRAHAREAANPLDRVSVLHKRGCVGFRGLQDVLFVIVKDIDIGREGLSA